MTDLLTSMLLVAEHFLSPGTVIVMALFPLEFIYIYNIYIYIYKILNSTILNFVISGFGYPN